MYCVSKVSAPFPLGFPRSQGRALQPPQSSSPDR